jgi:hypothetical protein
MTANEVFIAKRIDKGSGFSSSFLGSMRRQIQSKSPRITDCQADWLWELAWRNREKLANAGAGGIVVEAIRRHEIFDFRLRVRREREKARSGRDALDAVELKVEDNVTFSLAMANMQEAAQQTGAEIEKIGTALQTFGASLSRAAGGFAGIRSYARAVQQNLPIIEGPT